MFEKVLAFLNSETGMTIVMGILTYLGIKARIWKPKWAKIAEDHRGSLIKSVKVAEKAIPDDSEKKAVRRLNAALVYFSRLMERTGKKYKVADVKEAVNSIHAELEGEDLTGTPTGEVVEEPELDPEERDD